LIQTDSIVVYSPVFSVLRRLKPVALKQNSSRFILSIINGCGNSFNPFNKKNRIRYHFVHIPSLIAGGNHFPYYFAHLPDFQAQSVYRKTRVLFSGYILVICL